jgi:hypothetical protein
MYCRQNHAEHAADDRRDQPPPREAESYNTEHHITPRQVKRAISPASNGEAKPSYMYKVYVENETLQAAEDPIIMSMTGAHSTGHRTRVATNERGGEAPGLPAGRTISRRDAASEELKKKK